MTTLTTKTDVDIVMLGSAALWWAIKNNIEKNIFQS